MKTPHSERLFRRIYGRTALRDGLPLVPRNTIIAIIESFCSWRFLVLELNGRPGECALVTGGCDSLSPEAAAVSEIRSETGYQNMLTPRKLGPLHEAFYHPVRKQNQFSHHTVVYCRLTDDRPEQIEKNELGLHRPIWVPHDQVLDVLTIPSHRTAWRSLFLKEA